MTAPATTLPPGGDAGRRRRAVVRVLLPLAEITLTALTLAAVLGLGRLLEDGSFFAPVATVALLAHLCAIACRRRGLSSGAAAAVSGLALVLAITWLQLPETTTALLPTGRTLSQVGSEVRAAWDLFGNVVAPAPVVPGFVLAASVGAWWIAFAADTAAFRANAVAEAAFPATTLFVFGAALGAPRNRIALTAVFLLTLLGYWVAQRALRHASSPTWMARDSYGGTRSMLKAGALIGLAAVVAGIVFGPQLPGADAKGVIPWRATDRDGPASRVTVSPLVDIRSRLVEQADVEAFTVEVELPEGQRAPYWRLTSLEQFDGQIWKSNRQYRPARGELGAGVSTPDDLPTIRQEFRIENLDSIWLPAGFRPIALEGTEARYDDDSNSLLTESATVGGLRYEVESVLPSYTAEQLAGVPAEAPVAIAEEYLALPASFSPAVRSEAQRIVEGAGSQYEKAKRLQDHFRSGAFTYDLSVDAGHSGNALERFLFDTKRGYCEQFAGAYAAMARAIDLPARVAVGFTPGNPTPDGFSVRGYHGHAWPEVYLEGYGWVPFEPTPGRGIPNAEAYTGVPEQQAEEGNPNSATTVPTTSSTVAPGAGATTTIPNLDDLGNPGAVDGVPGDDEGSPWPRRLAVTLAMLALGPVLWVSVLAGLRWVRRWRRRRAAEGPAERVLVAWEEVGEALARIGAERQPWETPSEYAARAARATGGDERLLAGLAGVTTTAGFGPADALPEPVLEQALEVADRVEREADHRMDRRQRLRHLVDPRPMLPDRGSRYDVREEVLRR